MSGADPTNKPAGQMDVLDWLDAIDSVEPVESGQFPANDNGTIETGAAERAPLAPEDSGYSTSRLNEEMALLIAGSKPVVLRKNPKAPPNDRLRFWSMEAANAFFANRFTTVFANNKMTTVTWFQRWMRDSERLQYEGFGFYPPPDLPPTGYLNLWQGFGVSPKQNPGAYSIFYDHVFNNICGSRKDHTNYLFGWMAHLVQRPRERIGIAVVLRGKRGTGKTKFGEVLGALFPAHYFLVDDPRYVTGQFNAHMASCLLLQADEAVWAGDKTAEGRLKGLITATTQMIEQKGIDPIRVDNYVRVLMTSNEDWVVPAGKDERRYAVFDVGDGCAQNADYFREMDDQLRDGGYEALLHDLLAFDLSTVDLRRAPRTRALLDQKIRSLGSVDAWWFERLRDGRPTRSHSHWEAEVEIEDLFKDYCDASEKVGIKRRHRPNEMSIDLRKLMPTLGKRRPKVRVGEGDEQRIKRPWVFMLPPLAEARSSFEKTLGQAVDWEDADDIDHDKEGEE